MQAGDLITSVQVLSWTTTDDGMGGRVSTPTPGPAIPARVVPTGAAPSDVGDRATVAQTYRITVRNIGMGQTIKDGDVVMWGTVRMVVRSAPPGGRALWREITTETDSRSHV